MTIVKDMSADPTVRTEPDKDLGEVIRSFGLLGVTAFGGPTAHLGYFREEFVARRKAELPDEFG